MGIRFPRSACMALAALAMIVLPACQSAPAGKPASITYNDTKSLPPETLRERVLAQLGSVVSPAPPPRRWRPFERSGSFNDTWLPTRPRPAEDGGFCTYDLIQVRLSPDTKNDDRTRDTPMHAVGVAITTWFSPIGDDWQDCAHRDPASVHYLETDDPIRAGQDFDMLKDVLARLRSPKPGFSSDCSLMDHCPDLSPDITPDTLWGISACHHPVADGECGHFIWRDPHYIELDMIYDRPTLDRRVVRVHFEPGIIVD